ncbi:MAG: beta-lactamase family protein [Synergistaceae bacterium]|nr:beta-lactamase family protein [Synergistaceae bacterium]
MKRVSPFALIIFCFLSAVVCQNRAAFGASARAQTVEAREFASFVDGFLAGAQRERAIPGMVFAAVQNGEILYLKGYGVSDIASDSPVDPEKTLFRAGAVTQPVTAAAVMQLAERGRVGLDEDVNIFLRGWKLRNRFNEPVTPRRLMTHTSGLDCMKLETAAATSADERAYASRLPRTMPSVVSEPGAYYRASGMGYALLGSIIERYSRMNFDAAIKRYIFRPLGMDKSVFYLTPDDAENLAAGYDSRGAEVPYEYRLDPPAVGMCTTGRDMARFMIAQLSVGAAGRSRILGALHSGSMMNRHFSPHGMINGAGLGYLEHTSAGRGTLQRRGEMPGFSSFMMLVPEVNFGFFFAANESGIDFGGKLGEALAERFFPAPAGRNAPPAARRGVFPADSRGYYRTNDISRGTAEKITAFNADQIKVSAADGYLVTEHTASDSPPVRWLPVEGENDVFGKIGEDGTFADECIFFQRNSRGQIAALVMGSVGNTYDKLAFYDGYYAQRSLVALFIFTALLSFTGLYVGGSVNRSKFPWEEGLSSDTELWGISSVFCAVNIFFAAAIAAATFLVGHEFRVFVPYQVKILFVAPIAGVLILAWLWFRIAAKIPNPHYHWLEKTVIIIVALVETGYMLFLANWRLLGFMF